MAATTILQIIPRLDTGGAELATLEITQALVGAGTRALVASEGGRLASKIEDAGGELIAFEAATKNPMKLIANAGRLGVLIESQRVDLVHARSRAPAWSALMAAKRTGVPFVTTYHGAYGTGVPLKNVYNSVMARGDLVIANSEFTAALIRARHGTEEARLRVVHRGVDLEAFDRSKVSLGRIEALRKVWGLGAKTKIVLHAARLTGWKGQRQVIEAAHILSETERLKNTVFVLAGDDQGREAYRDELQDMIDGAGLGETVRLVGHCADMAAAFAAAHIGLVASNEAEAFGRAAAEAQAMACPVVASDLGASRETVIAALSAKDDRATGWLFPGGDAQALAGALDLALSLGPKAHEAMGIRARRHIEENFSLERMRDATLAVYDELLGSRLAKSAKKTPKSGTRSKKSRNKPGSTP